MTRLRLAACSLLCAGAAAAGVVLFAGLPGTGNASTSPGARGALLPNLEVTVPFGLLTQVVEENGVRHVRLGFYSAAANVGRGPLIIEGHRSGVDVAEMTADQVIQLANGQTAVRPDVGVLRYNVDETHSHWHLLRFMTYELRRATKAFSLVRPDQKTGFCLGDRYNDDPETKLDGEPDERVFNSNCGPQQTELLSLVEGISVGWGDVYEAWRDGQYLDITGLKPGRYVLVHRVNQTRELQESAYGNNASSVLLSITWPQWRSNAPALKVLRKCPGKARCLPRHR